MPIERISVYDLDGVLCDSSSRFKMGKNGNVDLALWRKSEPLSFFDALGPLANQYKLELKDPSVFVVIATARYVCWSGRAWLEYKLGWPQHLISRSTPDNPIGGADLKIKGLQKLLRLKQFKNKPMVMHEDNITYLSQICHFFKCNGVFVPSNQGF